MSDNSHRGIGFVGLLQVALIVLKLAKVIEWKWIVVFLPTILNVVFIVCFVFGLAEFNYRLKKNEEKGKK